MGLALAIAGCQDSYPIAATSCDRYCDLGFGPGCFKELSPAGCVVECEATWGSLPACSAEFDALVSCLKEHQHGLLCDYSLPYTVDGCESTVLPLSTCAKAHPSRAPIGAE